ncbi:unnamed protein product, partial [Ascophyllum nodosum]
APRTTSCRATCVPTISTKTPAALISAKQYCTQLHGRCCAYRRFENRRPLARA